MSDKYSYILEQNAIIESIKKKKFVDRLRLARRIMDKNDDKYKVTIRANNEVIMEWKEEDVS
jgi:hypothetical protein